MSTKNREQGAEAGTAEDTSNFTRKMLLAKKVHIFRHLSEEQTKRVVESFDTKKYAKGDTVIKQGEPGTSFFVIAQGELEVFIKDAAGEEKRVAGQ
eukprot:Skav204679  [mRNA]  locus=scaffold1284:75683:78347:- [translate_table: standard]